MSDEKENASGGKMPSHVAYQVSRGKDGQSYFNRIGAGFPHRDGNGLDVVLQSIPVDGRVTLRTMQERLENLKEGKSEPSQEKDQEREA